MPSWRKVITSGSNASLNSLYAPSITGSLLGTSSYAIYAETASLATNAQDVLIRVLNQSGNSISKGLVVHITASGNSSDIPRIVTASYEADSNSANTLGITNETIANGNAGYVMTEGVLKGIDTSAYNSGQLIYLGATGSIIGYAPIAPLHNVRLGQVIREQLNNGSIYVRIDNGYEIEELHDVLIISASSRDLLVRSGSVWINSKQLSGSYAITGSLTISGSSTFTNIGPAIFSGSVTSNAGFTGSLQGTAATASYVQTAQTASYVLQAVSASFASTASYYGGGVTKITAGSNISISPLTGVGDVTINATAASPFPYTGSAIISGSLESTGSFKIQGAGNGFTGPFTAIEVDDVNFSRKLFDFDTGSGSLDFGARQLIDRYGTTAVEWTGTSGTYLSNLYGAHRIGSGVRDKLYTNNDYSGQILLDVYFDINVQDNDLVYLGNTGEWLQVEQNNSDATKMLGIAKELFNQTGSVLIEGDIVVTTTSGYPIVSNAAYGLPVYIKEGTGTQMDTTVPVTGYVRLLGYCYASYNAGNEWIMKFRPSNEWVEL